ncbi:hypothetical protein QR680_004664 [Steinernema hermaphroditum]|uniref:Uncharacterized protein n=1 Tax=Steinernema hermaphroditum TaxID=289476 RepID=A0AA39HRL2_9BILA|nr:hypothetical protein QR680_004664 [Steinernema hermaphroditum]
MKRSLFVLAVVFSLLTGVALSKPAVFSPYRNDDVPATENSDSNELLERSIFELDSYYKTSYGSKMYSGIWVYYFDHDHNVFKREINMSSIWVYIIIGIALVCCCFLCSGCGVVGYLIRKHKNGKSEKEKREQQQTTAPSNIPPSGISPSVSSVRTTPVVSATSATSVAMGSKPLPEAQKDRPVDVPDLKSV